VYSGQFPGSAVVGAEAYVEDTAALRDIIRRACAGQLLDVPCGTAFWLSAYAANVTGAVLIDQSERMLDQARSRAVILGVDSKCTFLEGDVVNQAWEPESFDSMLVGFFLSHADADDEASFFRQIRRGLKRSGTLLVLDSIWNAQRARANPSRP